MLFCASKSGHLNERVSMSQERSVPLSISLTYTAFLEYCILASLVFCILESLVFCRAKGLSFSLFLFKGLSLLTSSVNEKVLTTWDGNIPNIFYIERDIS